jgi:hypothetical protein
VPPVPAAADVDVALAELPGDSLRDNVELLRLLSPSLLDEIAAADAAS